MARRVALLSLAGPDKEPLAHHNLLGKDSPPFPAVGQVGCMRFLGTLPLTQYGGFAGPV